MTAYQLTFIIRGAHPFDNFGSHATKRRQSRSRDRFSVCPSSSQKSTAITEQVLKKKIVDGTVEFDDFWDEMPDGALSYILVDEAVTVAVQRNC